MGSSNRRHWLNVRCAIVLALVPMGLGLSRAQTCTPESVSAHPGTWFEGRPSTINADETAPRNTHAAILKRIEPIGAMFREAYPEPRGTEANGQATIGRFGTEIENGPAQYGYTGMYKTWLCHPRTGQAVIAGETGNWAYVYVNSVHSLLSEVGEMEIDGRPVMVWLLARRIGDLRGETLYEPWMGLGHGRGLALMREGARPWKPVSQKQYLDALARHHEQEGRETTGAMDDIGRELEKRIEEVKRTLTGEMRAQVVAEMEVALAQFKAQNPQSQKRLAGALAEDLQNIRDYQAAHSEREMQQPAFLPEGFGLRFRGEFSDESRQGHMLVQVDPSYFRSDVPREVAQFITLLWQWENDSPASDAWRRGFEQRFPIGRLRSLLDR